MLVKINENKKEEKKIKKENLNKIEKNILKLKLWIKKKTNEWENLKQ